VVAAADFPVAAVVVAEAAAGKPRCRKNNGESSDSSFDSFLEPDVFLRV
jgi:hypothetical protein